MKQKKEPAVQSRLYAMGASGSVLFALTTGSFLAGYLSWLGASPQYCAIMAALPQLGCILQLVSPALFERMPRRKGLICLLCFAFRASLGFVVFLPVAFQDKALCLGLTMAVYVFGFFAAGFVTPGLNHWVLALAPGQGRGRFFAVKDMIGTAVTAIFSMGAGWMLDYFSGSGTPFQGYLVLFGFCILLSVGDFALMCSVPGPPETAAGQRRKTALTAPLRDKRYRPVLVTLCIWAFAIQFSVSFIPVYMVGRLGLSYSFITVVGGAASGAGMLAVYFWGRLADRTSWQRVLQSTALLLGIGYLGWSFVGKGNSLLLVPLLQTAIGCCNGAYNMSALNLQYAASPEQGKTAYLGVTAACSNILGFTGAMLGSALSKGMESWARPGWLPWDDMTTLFLLSALLIFAGCIYAAGQFKNKKEI